MYQYNPCDHYWLRDNGMLFSSLRGIEVEQTDAQYLTWIASEKAPTRYPRDENGMESIDELDAVLKPYGLRASPVSPREARRAAYETEADAFKREAENYSAEAYAWRLTGNDAKAAEAQNAADELFLRYLEKKKEIRARHNG